MGSLAEHHRLVLGVHPSAALCAAVTAAGGLGVLDLGTAEPHELELLEAGSAVRVTEGCALTPAVLDERVDTVVLGRNSPWRIEEVHGWRLVLAEVTSVAEAVAAVRAGADGLIARGNEAGGQVGELGCFVLVQKILGDERIGVPVWACGGIGPNTAAAAVVGGATGVVLDVQLALLPESELPEDLRTAIATSDGTNTSVVDGHRALTKNRELPIGQDAFLAKQFAQRYGTVARSLSAIRTAVDEALRVPDSAALAPGSPLAVEFGTDLPVAQGPMTRVSDRAGFAGAVADAGGLPFIALALATGEQTRVMLAEARDRLGDKPWGVGVLGFAPEELRAAQLAVIREVRPTHALIAGGRPDQAKALEDVGISTFLHVPSPGLLAQFLAAGARKFVFEGSECGGHIGPRSAFSLWEAQIAVLTDHLDRDRSARPQILFAGGVHDERSAAMITALAEPLTRRGARIGVLMGTGYLFTAEAVAHGAIQPLFQRQVVQAETTALLETAPGHVTRCVPSPFTETFHEFGARLTAEGVPEREVWQRLEQLNVGRLRVASKGTKRDGDQLVAVDEGEQLAEGLFMAGQVVVLRSEITTIAALHDSVTTGAARFRAAVSVSSSEVDESPAPLDVAIVGMACMFPGAGDLDRFWANIVANTDSVTEVPAERWNTDTYFAEGSTGRSNGDTTPSKWGGFLPRIPFDPLSYGIPPSTLAAVEPVQLLALEVAQRALADAGYAQGGFDRERTSVVFGAEAGSDLATATSLRMALPSYLEKIPEELAAQLPELTEDSFPGKLANVISGRIANRLDLGGANYTVDAACASSLAAVDVACKELVSATSDVVLCGGADLHNAIDDYLLFSSVGALSATGRCRTFDSTADGIALGEGVACVVLKRLADAERDGDRIYAVIKGVGSGSDGKALGLTAPRAEGQRRALERAYRGAGVSPAQLGLVEAHGTGTVVGDRTELETLTTVFTADGARAGTCVLGSVKSQIGHTKCAAGLAGLIKTAMALHTGVKPPTRHVTEPNPAWQGESSPFAFTSKALPWTQPPAERLAGVSAFGFGGTNFHVVVQGHRSAARSGLREWPAELFTFSEDKQVERLLELAGSGAWSLRDLARTAARHTGPARIAVVARDIAELVDLLRAARDGRTEPERGLYRAGQVEPGKLAVLFPGQGSQRPGMLAELFVAFPEIRRFLELAGRTAEVMLPADTFGERPDRLRDTRFAQPALGVTGLAVNWLLGRAGVHADMLGGHSYGELVALSAAGAYDASTLLELSKARAEAILAAAGDDPGGMAAVAATSAEIESLVDGRVVVANHNSPRQVVISGPTAELQIAMETLRAKGFAAKSIPVACAFHSSVVAPAGDLFAQALAQQEIGSPRVPVWSNRTASPYPEGGVRAELAAQIGAPVRFVEQIEAMYADGARTFLEAGPGRVLGGLVEAILGDRPHTVISCERPGATGLTGFLHALAQLAVRGPGLRTGWLFAGRDARDVSSLTPAETPGWTVDGQLVRTKDGHPVPGGLAPARLIGELAPQGGRDAVLNEYLRNSRELIAAQRDVLLSYLNAAPVVVDAVPVPVPAVAVPEEPVVRDEPDVLGTIIGIISERTGYPREMIDPELDLESDLSVDSIKRTEIAGELTARIGAKADLDELVKARTAGRMAALLAGNAPETPGGQAPQRFLFELVAAAERPPGDPVSLLGANIVIAGGSEELAEEVAGQLSARGAMVSVVDGLPEFDEIELVDGLISLHGLGSGEEPVLPAGFAMFRSVLVKRPRWVIAVADQQGVTGLRGFFRTLHREYPDTIARLVEVDTATSPEAVGTMLTEELLIEAAEPVVIRSEYRRSTFELVPVDLGSEIAPDATALGLNRDSVLVLVGGARGITARFAVALAAATGCRIELAGRTVLSDEREHPDVLAAQDLVALRGVLARLGGDPATIDRRARAVLAGREVETTLRELRAHGSQARYHTLDVRDTDAVRQFVKEIHAEHGRVDGVVYAAGVIEDRLVADKDTESFDRVYGTKVDGASALLAELAELPGKTRFTVLFGSIAAALGNRGQSDYAAANDALEALAGQWSLRTGARALTVHWGPWAPTDQHGGMVTPELGRSYAQRGISMIDPEQGVASLLRELAWGSPSVRSVVYTASGW
ncbi:type I polyketide synthase [Kutzneria viridogrisea]|uniref:Acyl transferase domain-containing protein n=1 Tax=Kutzneria viridogrisea TaxID=47990 RepID=A0ABR6BDA4_9PSEU|nr:acyl transferase domain-containing protein/NAD(P)H-dependent flavin oxidoreductase YrpB (nitropropane dioxygenase family)/NAD(P)-dependent dehydrogenase (short-subunit alcohol dehydrogenase family)/acyl carrier protein [Kutzneria viridogrisea]